MRAGRVYISPALWYRRTWYDEDPTHPAQSSPISLWLLSSTVTVWMLASALMTIVMTSAVADPNEEALVAISEWTSQIVAMARSKRT